MDQFDRKILDVVQINASQTHSEIGHLVGLSGSAVRRRLAALKKSDIIDREVVILRSGSFGVQLIVTVSFNNESVETYQKFDDQIRETPEILQGYHVSGAEDYILIVHGPNIEWYEDWGKRTFMNNPDIRRYDTRVVWSCKKFETAIPL